MDTVLEAKQITKRFGSVVANDHIDFDLRRGEIHCLLGENGAGKTTLMSILYGLWEADEGEVFVEGRKVEFRSPRDAMAQKLGMVSQHFNLIPTLTVTQNVVLGDIPSKGFFFFDRDTAKKRVLELADDLGFKIQPDQKLESLSVGEQQKVEILKALYHDARILILDEPTAVLTKQETEELFGILRTMTEKGHSIILITHKLNEAMNSNRLTVLRNGRVILTKDTNELTRDELAEAMFGKRMLPSKGRSAASRGRPVLEIKNLWTSGSGSSCLKDFSMTVCEGEIVGVAGVAGNGQKTLVDVIVGICPITKGTILLKSKDMTNKPPKEIRSLNIGCIPEERKKSATLSGMGVAENLILGREDKRPFARGGLLDFPAIRAFAEKMILSFDIKTAGVSVPVQHLSGGNLQKVILAREFASDPALIIASQPSRGLDVKTSDFIRQKFEKERQRGKAILLISYDLDEILEISDVIGVLYDGRIEVFPNGEVEPSEIGKMMSGIKGRVCGNGGEDIFAN